MAVGVGVGVGVLKGRSPIVELGEGDGGAVDGALLAENSDFLLAEDGNNLATE